MGKAISPRGKLLIIKTVHTIIWAFFVTVILYVLWSAIADNINFLTWIAISLVLAEGIILLFNGWRCPLTIMGEKYTSQAEVGFDIFLPKWVAKNNKTIFTTIYVIGIILIVYRLIK